MRAIIFTYLSFIFITATTACNSNSQKSAGDDSIANDTPPSLSVSEGSYIDLRAGKSITLIRDAEQGFYLYSDTKKPVEDDFLFVETSTKDTLYGKTGVIVDDALIQSADGNWTLNESMVERNGDEITIRRKVQ